MTDYRKLPDARAMLDVQVIHPFTLEPIPVEGMIDTGAAGTSLPEALMRRLGVRKEMCGLREVHGVGDARWQVSQ